MKKAVSYKITYLNFLLSCMIVGLHGISTMFVESYSSSAVSSVSKYFETLFDGATGAFFMLSAFLLYSSNGGGKRSYPDLVKKRIGSLLIPYVIYNSIALGYSMFYDFVKYRNAHELVDKISFKSLFSAIILKEYNPPMWFIPVLFCFVLLYPIIYKVAQNSKVAVTLAVGILIINILIGVDVGYSTVRYWLPIYLLGAVFGLHLGNIVLGQNRVFKSQWVYCVVWLILLVLPIFANYSAEMYYIYRHLYPVCIFLCIDCVIPSKKPNWIFGCSLFIFGMHIITIGPVAKIYMKLFGDNFISGIMSNIALPIMNVMVILGIAFVIRKYMPRIWKIAVGGR